MSQHTIRWGFGSKVHTNPLSENYFSYLRDARLRGAIVEVVLGDARLQNA